MSANSWDQNMAIKIYSAHILYENEKDFFILQNKDFLTVLFLLSGTVLHVHVRYSRLFSVRVAS